jgi:putative membrane protein
LDEASQSGLPANIQAHLAWLRTIMSLERTLDAWVRTAAALIGFGFTIVQFFEHFNQVQGVVPRKGPHLARYVGLLLIGIGTLALGIAVWQYQRVVKYLWSEAFRGIAGVPGMRRLYPAVTIAVLLCLVGLLALFAILVRGESPSPGKS